MHRKRRKQITLWNLALFFLVLAIISAIIAYFLVQPGGQQKENRKSHDSTQPLQTTQTKANFNNTFSLNGTWASNHDGSILDIHGTSFRLERPSVDSHHVENGDVFINGNMATFIYTDSSSLCKGKPGIYFFKKKKGRLIFKLKTDICPGRKEKFATVWDSI